MTESKSSQRCAVALRKVIELIFDPLIFLTMLTPLIIQNGIDWMVASVSVGSSENRPNGIEFLFSTQANIPALRGLVDYSVGLCVFIAAMILWIVQCFNQHLLEDFLRLVKLKGRDTPGAYTNLYGPRLLASLLGFVALVSICFICTMRHSITSTHAVNAYIDNVGNFLPPWDSPITWFRGFLALHVAFLVRPFLAHQTPQPPTA